MKLYVMRHGPAEDDSPTGRDGDRALTMSGRERVRLVAKALAEAGELPLAIVSSPLVRALQTAEIVAAEAKQAEAVEIRREMAPGGDALTLVGDLVRAKRRRVMVVGHEPDLSILVSSLVGRSAPDSMQKAMVVSVSVKVADDAVTGGAAALASKLRFVLDPKSLVWQRA